MKFKMLNCKPKAAPLPTKHKLTSRIKPEDAADNVPYAQLVGSLMHLMLTTRPDIAHAVSILCQAMAPGRHSLEHWEAGKHVLRYLQGTKDYSLTLGGTRPLQLTVHTDSAWADRLDDRKSSIGYVYSLGSGPISWRARKTHVVALSSMEAELYAAADACQELKWLQTMLSELQHPLSPCELFCDNQSALALIKHEEFSGRARHIDTKFHFIREDLIAPGRLRLNFVESADNLADIFTKSLPGPDHARQTMRLLSASSAQEARGV
jgi:hypothetical protein